MSVKEAASAYKKAFEEALAVRKPLEEEVEVGARKSVELERELQKVRQELLALQDRMLNQLKAYPKRGAWRRLKSLQAKAKDLEGQIETAREKESQEWSESRKQWDRAMLLGNEALKKADELLEAALKEN